MKILEVLVEGRKKKHLDKPIDDLDDMDAPEQDAELDKVPHVIMQLRKAKDVLGNYPIAFKNGTKFKLIYSDIKDFLEKYDKAKPNEKEVMQNLASDSLDGWHKALKHVVKKEPKHKIKGDRYMSGFAGDYDDK